MKKLILFGAALAIGSFNLFAQCTPGANFADSTFGAWPDTVQNFPHAMVDVAYVTDLNFKVPSDPGDIDPAYAGLGFTIQSFSVDDVQGLPTGMTYSCNISNCTYNGGDNGCAQITGTCATPGTYNVTIDVIANIDTGFGVVPYDHQFTGYKVIVDDAAGVSVVLAEEVKLYPNPVNDILFVEGLNGVSGVSIVDLNGQVVKHVSVTAAKEEINVSELISGVYFVRMEGVEGSVNQKFVKK